MERSEDVASVSGRHSEMYLDGRSEAVRANALEDHSRLGLPQHHRHALNGPNNAGQQQRGIEGAQCQLYGIAFQFANGRDEESKAHAAHALKQRQNNHPEQFTVVGYAKDDQHEDEHQRCLTAHDHKLGDDMREENLAG